MGKFGNGNVESVCQSIPAERMPMQIHWIMSTSMPWSMPWSEAWPLPLLNPIASQTTLQPLNAIENDNSSENPLKRNREECQECED